MGSNRPFHIWPEQCAAAAAEDILNQSSEAGSADFVKL